MEKLPRKERSLPEAPALAHRIALVAGGTGNVGRVVVRTMLERGATVVVPSRSPEKLEALQEELAALQTAGVARTARRLVPVVGNVADEEDGPRILDRVRAQVGPPDAVVASLGRLIPAPSLLEASVGDLQAVMEGYLLAHFGVARTLLPALRETAGSYTFVNGLLAFEPRFPGTGLVSVATAAQAMLARIVMKEAADGPARVNEVVLYTRFGGGSSEREVRPKGGASNGVTPNEVGRFVALLASPLGSGVRGRTIHLESREALGVLDGDTSG